VVNEEGYLVERAKLHHCFREELVGYFNQFPPGTQVVMEATCGWGWLSEVLEDLGLEVKLANPSKVRIIAESQIKTDKVDALALAQLLRTKFLPESYLAPKEQREARDLLRYQISLVHLRSGVKNRVHALLTRLGVYHTYSDLFGKQGRKFLSSLLLPPVHRQTLDGYLKLIDAAKELIEEAEVDIRKVVKESDDGKRLLGVPGIGFILAYLILVEIGDINRFASSKKLCSYAGLVPSTHQSGAKSYHGHLCKKSNRYLNWGMIEAAQKAKSIDPFLRRKAEEIERKRGAGVATVAMAHRLLVAVYYMLKEKTAYRSYKLRYNLSDKPVRPLVAKS
jgi:transposase